METPVNERLAPSRFSDRRYMFIQLRDRLGSIAKSHLAGKQDLRLVDFGCGGKPYQPLFAAYISRYIGVDLPENRNADVYASTGLPFADASVDVVLSTQVLEHVINPAAYLTECYRVLRVGGLLILSTHGYWMYHPHPTDLWRWTGPGLRRVIEDCGYTVVESQGLMGLASTGMHLLQDGMMPRIPFRARPIVSAVMQSLVALTDKLSSNDERQNDACTFIIVAERRR
jgi:SAM-dependent methyltransferase